MVNRLPKEKGMTPLAVPFSITIFKKCVRYQIDSALIKHLHFYDLQCLIMQFEIHDLQEYFKNEQKQRLKSQGIKEIKDISGADAIKFLGR